MTNPTQFHQLPKQEQEKRADRYVRSKAAMLAEGIPFDDSKGTVWIVKTYNTRTNIFPHRGEWVMDIRGKGKTSGKSLREFFQLFKRVN